MHIRIALYGAARVVIGTPQMDVEFDAQTITLGEVIERIIAQYPRARPYLLEASGILPSYIRVLINEVRPDPDATPATILHDQDRVILLVAVAGGRCRVMRTTGTLANSSVGNPSGLVRRPMIAGLSYRVSHIYPLITLLPPSTWIENRQLSFL
ncbi:MAG TPA: MoaD/ThiS family protein [Ktedonobacteraceae bacterium]|nr:MoaD/ThiS family protein [Ktedonobacteraceae bacterium]